jgi:hypothetical protein
MLKEHKFAVIASRRGIAKAIQIAKILYQQSFAPLREIWSG